MRLDALYYQGTQLTNYGRLPEGGVSGGGGLIPPHGRDLLTYGQYQPDATNTGLIPGTVLSDYNSTTANTVTIPNGAQIYSKRIYGDVTCAGTADVQNCMIYGGGLTITSGNTACLNFNNTRTGIAVFKDCTISPRVQSNGRDCALGKQYELWRCKLSGGVDGAGIYTTSTTNTSVDTKVVGCLIKGNFLNGTSHALPGTGVNAVKPWLIGLGINNGACIVIQDNTKAGIDSSVVIEDNWFSGGLSQMNIKPGISFTFNRNHHYRLTAQAPGWGGYWIRFDDHTTTVYGLNSGTNTNTWVDGPYAGALMTIPRDLGIEYNK